MFYNLILIIRMWLKPLWSYFCCFFWFSLTAFCFFICWFIFDGVLFIVLEKLFASLFWGLGSVFSGSSKKKIYICFSQLPISSTNQVTWNYVHSFKCSLITLQIHEVQFVVYKISLYTDTHTETYKHTHRLWSVSRKLVCNSLVREWGTFQFSSVAQFCPTLSDTMDCSTPGLPVHHQLLEFTQTHVHWISDAIQPSHPLSSPSPAFNLS